MQWQYKTVLFEFQKDGLLGDKYIDDEETESILNELGGRGWELVNVALIQEGLLAFCKRELQDATKHEIQQPESVQSTAEEHQIDTEPVSAQMLQQQEREHIQHLEQQRLATMSALDRDGIGEIKIF